MSSEWRSSFAFCSRLYCVVILCSVRPPLGPLFVDALSYGTARHRLILTVIRKLGIRNASKRTFQLVSMQKIESRLRP